MVQLKDDFFWGVNCFDIRNVAESSRVDSILEFRRYSPTVQQPQNQARPAKLMQDHAKLG